MSNLPLVSIIIPVYNRFDCLLRAIQSVFNQVYQNWEIIVIDDGSEEDFKSYICELQSKITQPLTYIRQDNQGPGIARKNGLTVSKGKYIQYLDSDDEILPDKLSRQVELLEENPDAVMCYTPTLTKRSHDIKGLRKFSDEYEQDLLKGTLEWRRWHTSSCLWHYPDKKIAYWSKYYYGEDVLHDVSVGVHFKKVVFIPEPLSIAHDSNTQLSRIHKTKIYQQRFREAALMVNVESHNLMEKSDFLKLPIYANPLSERFFVVGLKLFKDHDLCRGIRAIFYCIRINHYFIRTIFALISLIIAIITLTLVPNIFSLIFIAYRKITPTSVNFMRSV